MLFLEADVPGGPGELPHFYAVASYGLQHPGSMGYSVETLQGLRDAVADALQGRATVLQLRSRAARGAAAAGRVTRRGEDVVPRWPVDAWPMVVTDVVAGGAEGYAGRVEAWARSIVETLHGLSADALHGDGGMLVGRARRRKETRGQL